LEAAFMRRYSLLPPP